MGKLDLFLVLCLWIFSSYVLVCGKLGKRGGHSATMSGFGFLGWVLFIFRLYYYFIRYIYYFNVLYGKIKIGWGWSFVEYFEFFFFFFFGWGFWIWNLMEDPVIVVVVCGGGCWFLVGGDCHWAVCWYIAGFWVNILFNVINILF